MTIVEKALKKNDLVISDTPYQKIVEGLSKIDISEVTKDCNISELIANINKAREDVIEKNATLQEHRNKKKNSWWIKNVFNRTDDKIKDAGLDLQSSFSYFSTQSGKLLTINTAILKVLYAQQHFLNQQQSEIKDSNVKLTLQGKQLLNQQDKIREQQNKINHQNNEIQEQTKKIKEQNESIQKQADSLQIQNDKITEQNAIIQNHQNELMNANQRLSIQQSEINKAHEGLLNAKSITSEQARKLTKIVEKTENLEEKLQKSNENLKKELQQDNEHLKEYILSEIYKQEDNIDTFRQEIDYKFISINNKIIGLEKNIKSNHELVENEFQQTEKLIADLKNDAQDKYQKIVDALYVNEKNNLLLLNEYKIETRGSFESFADKMNDRFEIMVNMFERNKNITEQSQLKIKEEIIGKNKNVEKKLKRNNLIIAILSMFILGSLGLSAYIIFILGILSF